MFIIIYLKRINSSITVFSRLNATGVYFKLGPMDPAFIRSRRLIGARRLLKRCFFVCYFIKLIYCHPTAPRPSKVGPDRTIFPFILSDKLSLGLLLVTHHTIQHAYYCMLQSSRVKKEHKQYMFNIEARFLFSNFLPCLNIELKSS